MNKKLLWGIIVLVAASVIVGVVFVVDRESGEDTEQINQEVEEGEEDDLVWDIENYLFHTRSAIDDLDDVSQDDIETLSEKYDELEDRLWSLEREHGRGDLDDEEFEDELERLLDDFKELLEEIES